MDACRVVILVATVVGIHGLRNFLLVMSVIRIYRDRALCVLGSRVAEEAGYEPYHRKFWEAVNETLQDYCNLLQLLAATVFVLLQPHFPAT